MRGTNHLITCHHVVEGANPAQTIVVFEDKQLSPERILHYSQYDLASLLLPPNDLPQGGLELGEFAEVESGDDLLILGFPAGDRVLTAIRGMAAAKVKERNMDLIKFDATVAPGLSGSPCIHVASAKVIGVVSAQVPAAAILTDVRNKIDKLVRDAASLEDEARNIAGQMRERSGGVWISGVDPNAAMAYICEQVARVAADFKSIGQSLDQFAKRIPLGMGYAISIDHYRTLATTG